jgi:hypothetical protein
MVGRTGGGTGEHRRRIDRQPAAATCFPDELWPGRSRVMPWALARSREEAEEDIWQQKRGRRRARCCLRQWRPRHSASAGSCAEACEDEQEEASATRRRGKERGAPAPPFCPAAACRVTCALRGWRPPCVARVAGLAHART